MARSCHYGSAVPDDQRADVAWRGRGDDLTGAGRIALPEHVRSPWWHLSRRMLMVLLILVGVTLIVWIDHASYRDANGDDLSLIDAVYYTTVTLSTTGYGDIAPSSDHA